MSSRKIVYSIISILFILVFALSACAPAATPAANNPAPTQPQQSTQAAPAQPTADDCAPGGCATHRYHCSPGCSTANGHHCGCTGDHSTFAHPETGQRKSGKGKLVVQHFE